MTALANLAHEAMSAKPNAAPASMAQHILSTRPDEKRRLAADLHTAGIKTVGPEEVLAQRIIDLRHAHELQDRSLPITDSDGLIMEPEEGDDEIRRAMRDLPAATPEEIIEHLIETDELFKSALACLKSGSDPNANVIRMGVDRETVWRDGMAQRVVDLRREQEVRLHRATR